ncbi:MAG: peptidylprolyl isomerase [Gemmataceae bacterium]
MNFKVYSTWPVISRGALLAALAASLLVGCGKKAPVAQAREKTEKSTKADTKPRDERYEQPFAMATRTDPPEDWQPVEKTMTGKSVGKLYEQIKETWDSVRLTGKNDKPLSLVAKLETELGTIEITLRPDLAPNHVRNFLALAQVGYYDGLVFERQVTQALEDKPEESKLRYIEAGCPAGTGDPRVGSLGYWLKPEITKTATHEIGAVGACHEREADTAACKFYITLSEAPYLDESYTVFGKVTKGLEIAQMIYQRPVRIDNSNPEGDRPVKPVIIKKVTIETEN